MMDINLRIIQKLESEYGSPFYIFDEAAFIKNYQDFNNTLNSHYSKYQVSYSFKTNYTPYICSLVRKLGGFAEVVSGMEYDIAKKVGYTSDKIIFNGPNKGKDGLAALCEGCIDNVDNIDELKLVCQKAKENPDQQFEIGLRVNVDLGQNFISRFGLDDEGLSAAFDIIGSIPNLDVAGLHCHISRCRGIDYWQRRTLTMLKLADRYFKHKPPKYIDLGSGMFGKMDPELAVQFDNVPSYENYACVTAKLVEEHYHSVSVDDKPVLFSEPGTTLINRYIDFVGRIDAIKSIRGQTLAVLNCSEQNLGETCTLKRLPMKVISAGKCNQYFKDVSFVGYTCLEQDVMYTGFTGNLGLGDYIQFGNVGGYSNVYKPPFILPNCAMLVKKDNGEYRIIKRKETNEDLLCTYVF